MKATLSDHNLYATYVSGLKPNNEKDEDTLSYASVNIHIDSKTRPNMRNPSVKRTTNTVNNHNISNGNGLIINGSLFDGQLFQPSRSSYILDYRNTPHDLNTFLEGHDLTLKSPHLDAHLFKLSFIMTLTEWGVDNELLLDYCPRDDSQLDINQQISFYKKFCFPEITTREDSEKILLNESSTYIFTRTNSSGQVEYGFCRRIMCGNGTVMKFPVVICIGSYFI